MKRGIGILLACTVCMATTTTPAQAASLSNSVIVVGDPQLHNYLGGHLFQTTPLAAMASKVAQRYPEMNLLGGYAFDEGVALATALPGGTDKDPIILLGDGTNAACSGEFKKLMAHVGNHTVDDRIFLWAHGNHDTYLVGTTNTYPPVMKRGEAGTFDYDAFARMQKAPVPIDVAYWKEGELSGQRAWSVVCHDGNGSLPMNKSMWLAQYLASFGNNIKVTSVRHNSDSYRLEGNPAPGTELAARDFKMVGRWYPPPSGKEPMQAIYDMYDSYVVQAIDVGHNYRIILIDTSTCGGAALSPWDNAGTHGCINEDQIDDIKALAQTSRALIYGGHYHFDEIRKDDRTRLLAALNKDGKDWTYMSAHTHEPSEPKTSYKPGFMRKRQILGPSAAELRHEVNFGSTTDWPMQSHRVILDNSEVGLMLREGEFSKGRMVGRADEGRSIVYKPSRRYRGTEVCRHVDAAQQLAEIDLAEVWHQPWSVKRRDMRKCEDEREETQLELAIYEKTIAERMKDPEYREAAFAIIRGASERFHAVCDFF